MDEPIMKKVNGDGIEINLALWEGEGKAILCVHGITPRTEERDSQSCSVPSYHIALPAPTARVSFRSVIAAPSVFGARRAVMA